MGQHETVLRDMRDSSSRKPAKLNRWSSLNGETLFSAISLFGSESSSEAIPNGGCPTLSLASGPGTSRKENTKVIRRWRHGAMVLSTSRPLSVITVF